MSLGLSLSLSLASSVAFSPRSLFSAGEPGFWGYVSPSVLWQDVARTTPVTAAGQPVGSWQLNTAAGAIYATQSTVGSQPLYQDSGGIPRIVFDGTDDFLVTPTITPGTDKSQIFVGARKLSDGTAGTLIEQSTNSGANTGTIALLAPSVAATNYLYRTRGSAAAVNLTYLNAAVAAPVSNVLTGISDIATDTAIFRINGVQVLTSATDQGTGNFEAHPFYIGRRGGSTVPFNGYICAVVVRFGAALSAGQIASTETWCARRTGVTL